MINCKNIVRNSFTIFISDIGEEVDDITRSCDV